MDLSAWLHAARRSAFRRGLLNLVLWRSIPFNWPHRLRVVPQHEGGMRVDIPFRRANHNHIRGIHACCLATAAELCSGLALMEQLDAKRHRLIMKSIAMDYHWQAKGAARAMFRVDAETLERHVKQALAREEAALYVAEVAVHDTQGRHLATGRITWQIKPWSAVRTGV